VQEAASWIAARHSTAAATSAGRFDTAKTIERAMAGAPAMMTEILTQAARHVGGVMSA